MIRDDIKAALVTAMKSGDKAATGTIRLIQIAIKNRDIELRTSDKAPDDDALVTEVLQKMVKQRRESADLYRKGGRAELADTEEAEIQVIERFLPRQMSDEEARAAIQKIIDDTGASSVKDTREEALAFEQRIKGWTRAKKEALIAGDWDRVSWLSRKPAERPVGPERRRESAEVERRPAYALGLRPSTSLRTNEVETRTDFSVRPERSAKRVVEGRGP